MQGPGFLLPTVVHIDIGESFEQAMTTGMHLIRNITCKRCKETLGWKYDKAYEDSEKYKEGQFILESELLQLMPSGSRGESNGIPHSKI
jgi:hypothetical protein